MRLMSILFLAVLLVGLIAAWTATCSVLVNPSVAIQSQGHEVATAEVGVEHSLLDCTGCPQCQTLNVNDAIDDTGPQTIRYRQLDPEPANLETAIRDVETGRVALNPQY